MKTKLLLLSILLVTSNLVIAEELIDKGISLTRKGNDYVIDFELIDYKTTATKIRKSETETENFVRIDIPEYGIIYEEGMPQLPQISFSLAIPYDMEKVDFEFSVAAENEKRLEHKIYPTQYYFSDTSTVRNEQRKMIINDSIYSGKKKMEQPFVSVSEPFIVSGVKGVTVTVFPFQYDPVRNTLTVREKGTVRIKIGKEINTKVVETESMIDYLNAFFVNYGDCYNSWDRQIAARAAKSTTTITTSSSQYPKGNYLLIYPSNYMGYPSQIQKFMAHKESLGYRVLPYEYAGYMCFAGNCVSLTSVTEIMNVIQLYYDDPEYRPEYVLLVGDYADVGGWTITVPNGEQINSDLGYAMLEGGPNDPYADVGFGRWSVTNVTELNNIINKTIEMENKFRASSITPKRATLIADWDYDFWDETAGTSFEDCIPLTKSALQNDGYTCTTILEHHGGTTQQIVDQLNNGSYAVVYRGHGGTIAWSGPGFGVGRIDSLTNSIYPVVFSISCNTGNFVHEVINDTCDIRCDSEKYACLGEEFIRSSHGACAFWGATRTTDHLANTLLSKCMFTHEYPVSNNISKIINASVKRMMNTTFLIMNLPVIPNNDNKLRSLAAFNLLGDPSLQIRFDECLADLKFCGGETDNGETLQYPIASVVTVGGNVNEESGGYYYYQDIPYTYVVRNGGNLSLQANNSITLKPGFTAQAGSTFSASITSTTCSPPSNARRIYSTEYKIEDDIVLSDDSIDIISFETVDVQVSPNPFNEFIKVSFYCYKQTKISLKLYDIQGKLINFVADNIVFSEGKNEINIEDNSLAKGMYLLKLTVNNQDFIYKLIKN